MPTRFPRRILRRLRLVIRGQVQYSRVILTMYLIVARFQDLADRFRRNTRIHILLVPRLIRR